MLGAAKTKLRQARSLPNILLEAGDEVEIEKLVEEDSTTPEDEKTAKKKWYNRLPSPSNLLNPLRRSLTKLKRKHDHYEAAEDSDGVSWQQSTRIKDAKLEHEQFNYLSERKFSISDQNIPYSVSEQVTSNESAFESGSNSNSNDASKGYATMKRHFAEARALANGHVTIADLLSVRYRKL